MPSDTLMQLCGSHLPILDAMLSSLRPSAVVECGCGLYSTPLIAGVRRHWIIEHDLAWVEQVRRLLVWPADRRWILEALPTGVTCDRAPADLDEPTLAAVRAFYARQAAAIGPVDLLFVDTFACARSPALMSLGPLAKVVMLHDSEEAWADYYQTAAAAELLRDRHHYRYRPDLVVDGRPVPYTDIWSVDPLDVAKLQIAAGPFAVSLWGRRPPLLQLR